MSFRAEAILGVILLAGCFPGAKPSLGCVFGQESRLIDTIMVRAGDDRLKEVEANLREIAHSKNMVFGSTIHPSFPSGRLRISFHMCGVDSYVFATRVEDQDEFSIFVSNILQGDLDSTKLLTKNLRESLGEVS